MSKLVYMLFFVCCQTDFVISCYIIRSGTSMSCKFSFCYFEMNSNSTSIFHLLVKIAQTSNARQIFNKTFLNLYKTTLFVCTCIFLVLILYKYKHKDYYYEWRIIILLRINKSPGNILKHLRRGESPALS